MKVRKRIISSPLYFQTCAFPRLWRHFRTTSKKRITIPQKPLNRALFSSDGGTAANTL